MALQFMFTFIAVYLFSIIGAVEQVVFDKKVLTGLSVVRVFIFISAICAVWGF